MKKIVILGASGMLGSTLTEFFSRQDDFAITATARSSGDLESLQRQYPQIRWTRLDAASCSVREISEAAEGAAWIINAIGVIKQKIVDSNDEIAEQAIRVNAVFPFLLAQAAAADGFKVIQIATDCVYSGSSGGRYTERVVHDCHDVYGKTKSLGEVHASPVCNLRCSIVGPERKSSLSLLNWFLGNPRDAHINGYANHFWNGITALHFAKICRGMIAHDLVLKNRQHVVPHDEISKEGLLRLFASAFGRDDIIIAPAEATAPVNRILNTDDPAWNATLWRAAGYARPPGIADMVFELAEYMGHLRASANAHEKRSAGK